MKYLYAQGVTLLVSPSMQLLLEFYHTGSLLMPGIWSVLLPCISARHISYKSLKVLTVSF